MPPPPAAGGAAPVRPGRRLLLLLALLAVGGVALAGLPSAASDPDRGLPLALPGAAPDDRPAEVGAGAEAAAEAEAAARLTLRSVSTAPTRPRLGDAATDAPLEAIERHTPVVRVDDAADDALAAVRAVPGVAHAAAVDVAEVRVVGGERVSVGLVGDDFRPLSPRYTAESPDTWRVLAEGGLLVSPDRAAELRLRPGGVLPRRFSADLPVGAVASNGAPPLFDAIASRELVDLGRTSRTLLVAAAEGVDPAALAEAVAAAVGGSAAVLPAGSPATARLVGTDEATVAAFAPFTFRSGEGGEVVIDPAWVEAHIVREQVPIVGTVTCHRLIVPQLRAALQALVDRGLADLVDPSQYGGCYVPRHIDRSPAASLSMHAWGIAFDINVSTNLLGAEPQLDPRVVQVMTEHGFSWGGDWRRPDGMHFELAWLLDERQLGALAR
jgi:hypothetical protein